MSDGVKKVNEFIMKPGRTLIVTDNTIDINSVPAGTIYIEPITGAMKLKYTGGSAWGSIDPTKLFPIKSIVNSLISDQAITKDKIALNAIDRTLIKDLEIITSKIADNAVSTSKLANDSISNIKILDNTINNSKLENKTIDYTKIADAGIIDINIANNTITTIKLADKAATTAKIDDSAITETKLADLSISTGKIRDNAITNSKIADDSVGSMELINLSVTESKIADDSISTLKIKNLNITESKIADDAITTLKIKDLNVTNNKIANLTITGTKIVDKTLSESKMDQTFQDKISTMVRLVSGTATVNGNLKVTGNINADGNITGAKVYNAVLADLAEGYIPGEELEVGDIVEIREDGKVYRAYSNENSKGTIVGVVSNNFATCFDATPEEIQNGTKVAVGLIGKVPIKISGKVRLGDKILCDDNGIGRSQAGYNFVGKALESKATSEVGLVLCLVFPNIN